MNKLKILNQRSLNLKFNWSWVLAFVTFWVYGFYGAVLTRDVKITIIILSTLFFTGIFMACIFIGLKKIKEFEESIYFSLKDLFVWLSYIFVLLPFCWDQLTSFLEGDQIGHAMASKKHALLFITKI